jgi:hypothetical protein
MNFLAKNIQLYSIPFKLKNLTQISSKKEVRWPLVNLLASIQ